MILLGPGMAATVFLPGSVIFPLLFVKESVACSFSFLLFCLFGKQELELANECYLSIWCAERLFCFLGLAVARDIKGKRDRVVAVIDNVTITAGQAYEAMSNAGYLDSNMIVILNDSRHSLHPNMEEGSKASISTLSSIMSKIQSSKIFRKFREFAKVCMFHTLFMKLIWLQL